ncbi:conserved Plasmodium protein, unknown function [Plasmodium berghei]|uniref:Uncharacterized protein n=2 Tax=Plasmodium berghei TaxID=5821 RepID=A0A509AMI9_PLABA|nr:conserved Plasmodium protein, unknown function [Plasmodium berghei ANKA]CXI65148.1 conserved Plasmodium protein, unknown function [Plasmodium berghei]SCM23929.1 conserved Plasmodium protein, unknown function [Plasmodium berghei]SCN26843.1 conserved Plasmodium protein, unknown function [Plasmodium berghei]SCO61223.1 conserved Plasmodium protein, unknown function [Plasmodium berghei]SCO63263.1 conserved Plasmodium protein, unknown function [Plasmodium berghei]|eukprot:XP_034422460.1 conserved Plasmodium protein, unknown function [Plasmodium berghei ANKA]
MNSNDSELNYVTGDGERNDLCICENRDMCECECEWNVDNIVEMCNSDGGNISEIKKQKKNTKIGKDEVVKNDKKKIVNKNEVINTCDNEKNIEETIIKILNNLKSKINTVMAKESENENTEKGKDCKIENSKILKRDVDKIIRIIKKKKKTEDENNSNHVKELKEELEKNIVKQKQILKSYEEEQQNVKFLHGQLDQLQNMFDNNQKKEDKWNCEKENYLEDIESLKCTIEELEIKIEKKNSEIENLKRECEHILLKVDNLEKNNKELKNENNEMNEDMNLAKKESNKKNIVIDNLKKDLEEQKRLDEEYNKDNLIIEKNTEIIIEERNFINDELIKTQKLLENQINKNKDLQNIRTNLLDKIDLLEKKQKEMLKKNNDIEQKLEDINKKNKLLINENKMKDNEIANNISMINNLNNINGKMKIKLDQEYFKNKLLEKEKKALNVNVKSLTYEIQSIIKLTEEAKVNIQNQKREINDLIIEKEQTKKLIEKIDKNTKQNTEIAKQEKINNINLEKDIKKYIEDKKKLNEDIQLLVKEKEKLLEDLSHINTTLIQNENDLIEKDTKINTYVKVVSSLKSHLAKEKAIYENVKSKKITTTKLLAESKDKLMKLGEKYKLQSNELELIKTHEKNTEIKINDTMEEKKKLINQCEKLKEQIEKYKNQNESSKTQLFHDKKSRGQLEGEINELNNKIKVCDKNIMKIKKEKDMADNEINERDDQIVVLKDKLKLLQISHNNIETTNKNQTQKIQDLNKIVSNIKNLNELHNEYKELLNSNKVEINALKKELISEQNKVKSLSEELEKPINIHRWRNLEGSDPTAFDLIHKLKNVQKKLIEKTEESIKKNALIQSKTKECENLQKELINKTNYTNVQDITKIKQELRKKETLIKSLTSEISMYQEDAEKTKP